MSSVSPVGLVLVVALNELRARWCPSSLFQLYGVCIYIRVTLTPYGMSARIHTHTLSLTLTPGFVKGYH